MKIHFGHRVGIYDPSTELPRDFCAGIGPLQLGVVLVLLFFSSNVLFEFSTEPKSRLRAKHP